MTQEEIDKRIEEGKKKKDEWRKGIADQKAKIKEGVQFIHENKKTVRVELINSNGTYLAVGADKQTSTETGDVWLLAYSVCSPKDTYSNRVAKGIVGYSLKHQVGKFFPIGTTEKNMTEKRMIEIGYCWIKMSALGGDKQVPERLRRAFTQCLHSDDIWYLGGK